jgi:hypothetical protein
MDFGMPREDSGGMILSHADTLNGHIRKTGTASELIKDSIPDSHRTNGPKWHRLCVVGEAYIR